MVYVIFAHSHLYFKSPHLVTHFFCLAHSAVRILVSTSYKAPGSLSAKRKKKKQQEENKWDCYINWTLKHFRSSGCLPLCTALLNSTVGLHLRLAGGSGFSCGMGVWMRVSGRESSYRAWVVNVLETVATSWEIYMPTNSINSPQAIFFLPISFSLYLTHPHIESVVPVQNDLTPQPRWSCSGNVDFLLCSRSTSNDTESAFMQYEGQGPFCVLYRLRCSWQSWHFDHK